MKLFYQLITSFLVLYLLALYFFGINYLQLSCDAGYYLAIARDISRGNVLFRDIFNVYAPLTFSYFSLFFRFNENISYEILLSGQIFLELLGGIAFYLIAKKLTDNKPVSIISSILYLIAVFLNEGFHIMLEPMVLLFMLWALVILFYFPFNWGYLISGALVGNAFLSKQYALIGLVIIVGFILIHETEWRKKIKGAILAQFSFLLVIGIYFYYKIYFHGIGSTLFFKQFFPSNVGHYDLNQNNFLNVISFIFSLQMLIYLVPLISVLIMENKNLLKNKILTTLVVAHVLFLSPLHVFQFIHYKMLFLPYTFLLFAYLLNKGVSFRSWQFGLSILLISAYLIMPVRAFSAFYQGKEKEKQYQLAIALKQFIPPGSRVALYSNEEQYFLANLSSCDLKKYSYSFITYLPDDKIYASADYVIFDKIHVPDTARMRLVYNINYAAEIKPGIYIFKKNVTP